MARGLTNKEIAFALGISERGVAAQVSRLLAKYGVPNRAALIAQVMSDAIEAEVRTADPRAEPLELTPEMARECATYEHSAFMVSMTLGVDNLIVFLNKACQERQGMSVETAGSTTFKARRGHPATAPFVEGSKAAFRTACRRPSKRKRRAGGATMGPGARARSAACCSQCAAGGRHWGPVDLLRDIRRGRPGGGAQLGSRALGRWPRMSP